ncbi:type 1 glutamine amidotransferase [candidate division KSB1 bacterium]|nr:type 1 glutamine amidotransferase [candidate division KSB1 bacterium]MCH8956143.1 type 1 glutamine amidotransferase [candidate division KSB1 bacterium]TDJ02732.1 MAG: type 1 glutamine amidotransferase [Caldithrix sp.]
MENLKFTLIQCRNPDDPMREQEIQCFSQALNFPGAIVTGVNILEEIPHTKLFEQSDAILIGGSGDYGVIDEHAFLHPLFKFLGDACEAGFPMFASCFGFQALCQALGGNVIRDSKNTEVGTYKIQLTDEGKVDPLFSELPEQFYAQVGHKDRADKLPIGAVNLAFSDKAPCQAYKIKNKPIYATQFHPELTMAQNRERFEIYIDGYTHDKTGMDAELIRNSYRESRETYRLLPLFVEKVLLAEKTGMANN